MYHGNLMASFTGLVSPGKPPVLWSIRQALDGAALRRRLIVKLGALFSRQPAAIIYNSATGARQHAAFGYRPAQQTVIPNGFDCQLFRPDPEARREERRLVIPNGFDTEVFRPSSESRERVRAELGASGETVLVGLVARYHPMKDQAGFLRAAAMVAKEHPSVRFVLIGRGTRDQPALQNLIAELQLQDRVFLLGERPDMPRMTAALDIACSGSAWGEGFSNAIGEAMACGVPCVVTEVGDSPYLVGQTGLCVPPSQPEASAHAIGQLISAGPDLRRELGSAARRRVEENFSLPAVVGRFEEVFATYLQPQNGKQILRASAIR
jgi:glycosyltransferase involved in cell wall biosynthesis